MTDGNVVPLKQKSPHKRAKITEATVKRLSPREKPYFIRDTELKGFAIQVNPKRDSVFRVEARLGGTGNNVNATIGSVKKYSVKDARKIGGDYLRQIREGIDPKIERKKASLASMTFEQLFKIFLDDRKGSHKARTQEDYIYFINK